jgi:tetratricopeptide (TPR) repeat protein
MRRFACLVLLCIGGQLEASEGLAGLYNQGNASYRQGNYGGAISLYEQVIGHGFQNGEVYYNLGNAYFKNEQLGHAILAYERALKLMPGDEDVLANLRFANAHKVDKETEDAPNLITRLLRGVYDFFDINTLSLVFSVFVFCIGATCVGWLFKPLKRVVGMVLLVAFGSGLMGSGVLLLLKVYERGAVAAVVIESEAVGRSGPGSDFLQVFVLHEGTKVFVERSEGNWLLVKLSNGVGGWLDQKGLGQI